MEKNKKPKCSGKGSAYEREIAVALSLWWTQGFDADAIWRTNSSGARFTSRRKTKNPSSICAEAGDLKSTKIETEALFNQFLIELKRGMTNQINLTDHLDTKEHNRRPYLEQIWQKAEDERLFCNRKEVMIIFRRNCKKDLVMVKKNSILFAGTNNRRFFSKCEHIVINLLSEVFVFILFSDLILYLDPWCEE